MKSPEEIVAEYGVEKAFLRVEEVKGSIHHDMDLQGDDADQGEVVAEIVSKMARHHYRGMSVQVRSWPAPNYTFSIVVSVSSD